MLTVLACFALGLFVGGYALSSFAPVAVASKIYMRNWITWALFLILAYLQQLGSKPRTLGVAQSSDTNTLIAVVILGIIVAFVGGMAWARRQVEPLEGGEE